MELPPCTAGGADFPRDAAPMVIAAAKQLSSSSSSQNHGLDNQSRTAPAPSSNRTALRSFLLPFPKGEKF